MTTFINIFSNVIVPIFILILIGFIGQKKLQMDIRTFTKLNIYIFVPAIIFAKVYDTEITLQLFGLIFLYLVAIFFLMLIIGLLISRILNYPRGIRNAFLNSLLFFNAGNYGLPIAELAFHNNPLATTAQIFIMITQNILGNTVGVFQASAGKEDNRKALKNVLTMPALYTLIIVGVIKVFDIQVANIIMFPIENIAKAFIPMALITLGVQLAEVKINTRMKDILISAFVRLLIAPVLALVLVKVIGLEGILAKSLILGVATPTAVNMAIIAKEFNNEPEYASQVVFVSTVLSVITISGLIYLLEFM